MIIGKEKGRKLHKNGVKSLNSPLPEAPPAATLYVGKKIISMARGGDDQNAQYIIYIPAFCIQ